MPKYIDADILKAAMVFSPKLGDLTVPVMRDILAEIDSVPAADVEPVRHGRWIDENPASPLDPRMRCSVCGHVDLPLAKWRFCPVCGAKLEE